MTARRSADELRDATRRLEAAGQAAQSWTDQARRSFDDRFMRPLLAEARHGQRAVDELAAQLERALAALR